jgi:hypothetical protein
MPKLDNLFPGEPEQNNTPRHPRKHQRRAGKLVASSRNARRHDPQRFFGCEYLNLKRRNKPYHLHRCDGKFQFERKREATRSADSYMDQVCLTIDPMVPYYCSHHGKWHIGHDSRFPQELRAEYQAESVKRARMREESQNLKRR